MKPKKQREYVRRWERVLTMEQLAAVCEAKRAAEAPFVSVNCGRNLYNGTPETVTVRAI